MVNVCTPKVCIPDEIILGSEIAAEPKVDYRPVQKLMTKLYIGTTVIAAALIPANIAMTVMHTPHY